ncbi:hypothetical protein BATDEDRAFT_88189 [Batrachochytrium dendrobatidis JAM81]|uniref:Uncharacterized protein n=1 Tax=Batrachochytrium dendrobatidis (strain JAM81 / FGSC 10211) TaxID=684364 RepID=F4P1Y3_BATDJ|nr:uncharacterized protein BATDEDRAFT_88431 [Batrachochytrium dendrobatidis JAM81]XP_006678785.1 uncharacterized protein BATDEDRAFT_88189 [Batrachochytrium dendrobatidis JAM81]EGF80772.1 hypothetical protein BATDEDRAFT_88431 [Batrachochytrium dendrobatidis JAM81]EGF81017.1 hypothetical protein BATDEDRAFT_88189 [Batrachochytrium dendrobatidis JAM81]|eukprot:XP_006678692.1 hypothetical protein BATDEDRAFT_88431 [Batrachochytrium dendrobatidis JAM81]
MTIKLAAESTKASTASISDFKYEHSIYWTGQSESGHQDIGIPLLELVLIVSSKHMVITSIAISDNTVHTLLEYCFISLLSIMCTSKV